MVLCALKGIGTLSITLAVNNAFVIIGPTREFFFILFIIYKVCAISEFDDGGERRSKGT